MQGIPFAMPLRLTLLCLALAAGLSAATPAASQPNVVVILADDQGWGDLSINGNRNIRTPNIDSIGRAGVVFDRFYVCSVCAPTRAEFLTGRYHSRGGVRGVSTGQERLNLDERTLAEAFRAAGYATGAFGKWHNGSQWPYHPNARGFQEYYGFTSGHWGEYFNPPLEHNGQPVRGEGYITDVLTDRALEFITRNQAKPFFCYVPYNTPHSPFSVPDKYWKQFAQDPVAQRGLDGDKEDVAVTRAVLAMTANLDDNVGRILRRLDELRLSDNTIVLYFSDNGPNSWRWNGGMKGRKGSTDEGGLRSPLMLRWPARIPAGRTLTEITGAIDLLPTLTALTGVPRVGAKPLDGVDLSPLLLGTARNWPDRMIFSHQNGNVSARSQRFRYDAKGALYDMTADPGQQTDVAARLPADAGKFSAAVAAWRRDVFGSEEAAAPADRTAAKAARKAAGGNAKVPTDGRPFPVGYREFPRTPLPARDGVPHGGVRRSANAPNSSYFTKWTSTDDTITWDIEVHETGTYAVALLYTCPAADIGSTVEVSFRGAKVSGQVAPAWDPPLNTNDDRVTRVGESYMKDFRPLELGTVRLEAGRGQLTVRATRVAGQQVMDLRMVTLTLQ